MTNQDNSVRNYIGFKSLNLYDNKLSGVGRIKVSHLIGQLMKDKNLRLDDIAYINVDLVDKDELKVRDTEDTIPENGMIDGEGNSYLFVEILTKSDVFSIKESINQRDKHYYLQTGEIDKNETQESGKVVKPNYEKLLSKLADSLSAVGYEKAVQIITKAFHLIKKPLNHKYDVKFVLHTRSGFIVADKLNILIPQRDSNELNLWVHVIDNSPNVQSSTVTRFRINTVEDLSKSALQYLSHVMKEYEFKVYVNRREDFGEYIDWKELDAILSSTETEERKFKGIEEKFSSGSLIVCSKLLNAKGNREVHDMVDKILESNDISSDNVKVIETRILVSDFDWELRPLNQKDLPIITKTVASLFVKVQTEDYTYSMSITPKSITEYLKEELFTQSSSININPLE